MPTEGRRGGKRVARDWARFVHKGASWAPPHPKPLALLTCHWLSCFCPEARKFISKSSWWHCWPGGTYSPKTFPVQARLLCTCFSISIFVKMSWEDSECQRDMVKDTWQTSWPQNCRYLILSFLISNEHLGNTNFLDFKGKHHLHFPHGLIKLRLLR